MQKPNNLTPDNFNLSPTGDDDRIVVPGLTIDEDNPETAVWFDFDTYNLMVSVLDTTSILESEIPESRLNHLIDSGQAHVKDRSPLNTKGLKPYQQAMRFAVGEERPGLTVQIPMPGLSGEVEIKRSMVVPQSLTAWRAGYLLERGEDETSKILLGLDVATRHLLDIKDTTRQEPDSLERYINIGTFLIERCMMAADGAVADFMNRNGIPAIYLNQLWSDPSKKFLSSESYGNSHIGVHNYATITSPLQRFQDFANQVNLLAALDGQTCPYPEYKLDTIIPDLNQHYDYTPLVSFSERSAEYLREVLVYNSANAKTSHIANAIFAAKGTTDNVKELRGLAMEAIEQNPDIARSVVDHAISKGYLIKRPATPEDQLDVDVVLEDRDGNVYAGLNGDSWRQLYSCVSVLGRICRIRPKDTLPGYADKIDNTLNKDSYRFLHRIAVTRSNKRPRLRMYTGQEADGTVVMDLYVRGKLHRRSFKGANRSKSILGVAKQHILDHGLLYSQPSRLSRDVAFYSPGIALNDWRVHTGADPVEFTTTQEGDGVIVCKARLRTKEGEVYESTGIGFDYKAAQAAKRSAAAFLLQQLPHGPYPTIRFRSDMSSEENI